MKSLVAKLSLVALVAAPLVSHAQNHLRPADKLGSLTLLPGPRFLSPAEATGEVVPGQVWTLKKGQPQFVSPSGTLSLGPSAGIWTIGSKLSSPTPFVSGGQLTFSAANKSPLEKENFVRKLKSISAPLAPESLRFDSKIPPTVVPPLQKKPAPAPTDLKSL